jgi:hypothetical protein
MPRVLYDAANLDLYESLELTALPPADDDDASTDAVASLEMVDSDDDSYYSTAEVEVTVVRGGNNAVI